MITVALQVVQQDIRRDVIGVPTVTRLDALVTFPITVVDLLAQQAVMLQVVDRLQQGETDDRLQHDIRQDHRSQPDHESNPDDQCHRERIEDVVPDAPRVLLAAGIATLLQIPSTAQGSEHRARPEGIETLTHPRGRWVLRCGHAHVVSTIVFDIEVTVGASGRGRSC